METFLEELRLNPLKITCLGDPILRAAHDRGVDPDELRAAIDQGRVETLHGYAASRGFYRPSVRIFFAR